MSAASDFRSRGGFMPSPTPGGVPVAVMSPGCSVMEWLTSLTSLATLKIMVFVLPVCMHTVTSGGA